MMRGVIVQYMGGGVTSCGNRQMYLLWVKMENLVTSTSGSPTMNVTPDQGGGRRGQKKLSSVKTTTPRTPNQHEELDKLTFEFPTSKEGKNKTARENLTDGKKAV